MRSHKYIIGVDEVGRGSIAGPVAVGVLKLKVERIELKESEGWFQGLRDSKKLTPQARDRWFAKIEDAQREGWLDYAVIFSRVETIDQKGIVYAIRSALARGIKKLSCDSFETLVLLDGGLKAPKKYIHQQTIIKGDEKEYAIALASIAAKVTRDRRMTKLARKHPDHHLHAHKGYGTKAHYEALKQNGLTKHHRKSFLTRVIE